MPSQGPGTVPGPLSRRKEAKGARRAGLWAGAPEKGLPLAQAAEDHTPPVSQPALGSGSEAALQLGGSKSMAGRSWDPEAWLPGFEFQLCHLIAVRPFTNYLTSLCLILRSCKIIILACHGVAVRT